MRFTNPGHFSGFVTLKYLVDNMNCFRKLKETTWIKTEDQLNENSIVVKGLEPGHTYQFRVVAVDGELLSVRVIQF